jgi:uncharacterized protein
MTILKFLGSTSLAALVATSLPMGADAQSPRSLNIGTSAIGGTYYVYGGAIATVLQDATGIPVSVEVTAGPSQNIALVDAGQLDIGLVTTGPLYDSWTGNAEWTGGEERRDFRILFPMFMTPFHGITLAPQGSCKIEDVVGSRLGIGPAASTPGTYLPIFLPELGITATLQPGGTGDQASQLMDGLLDHMMTAAGIPVPAVQEIRAQRESCLFGFSDEQIDHLEATYPFVGREVIPAGTYEGYDEDLATIGMWNFAVAHADMDADFVYNMVKTIMENNEAMVQTHSSAAETLAENIGRNSFAWLHPGAIRYYEEIGIELGDHVYPPEMN